MAATIMELPYPVLSCIIGFLPISDIVNMSKVCKSWQQVASKSLKTIKIDASTVYGGSWQKYYEEQETVREKNFEKFARQLADCTDEIEHLYFHGSDIPRAVFEILLSSQKELKTLDVFLERKHPMIGTRRTDIAKVIIEGLVRHAKSLEKISIGIEDTLISVKEISDAFSKESMIFPNLISIEFLSTTAGDNPFDTWGKKGKKLNAVEFKGAELLFPKIFAHGQIKELNFKPKKPLSMYTGVQVHWSASYAWLLINHFKLGDFSNLRKINIDSLNTRKREKFFSGRAADLLIRNCPHISHIDSDLFFTDVVDYSKRLGHNEKPFIKVIKHYGPQLVYLHSYTNTNIAKCIVDCCPNVKTLTIVNYFGDALSESALIALSGLQKLKKVTVLLSSAQNGLLVFLDSCVSRLTKLQILLHARGLLINQYHSEFDEEIFHIIEEKGKNLQALGFYFNLKSLMRYKVAMEAIVRMLTSCCSLRCLMLNISGGLILEDESLCLKYVDKLSQVLISSHLDLHQLTLYPTFDLPEEIQQTLIRSMPCCKMTFHFHQKECYKF